MKLGNLQLNSIRIGSTAISKIFTGDTQIWPNYTDAIDPADFVFKIDTSLGDGLAQFQFDASHTGIVDYTIDWGDSSTTHVNK